MKHFSFLNTDLFQVSLWFPLNNDDDMASALGKRCSTPVYKKEMEMERVQWCRRWPWATVFYDLSLDAYVLSQTANTIDLMFSISWSTCLHYICVYVTAKNEIISSSDGHRQEM